MPVERSQVERWLREDLGHHDVTNDLCGQTTGRLVAGESGVAAGVEAARATFEYLDVAVDPRVEAGEHVDPGAVVLAVQGPTRGVLRGERVAVNIIGHASGVATQTKQAVDTAHGVTPDVRIAATRKTTPGLRGIEKRAVAAAGGDTHRLDLSHMAMVKDNHIVELGLERAVERVAERVSFTTKVEAEVEDPADARRAARAGADVVMLDNMSPAETRRGVEALPEGVLAEASGDITIDEIPLYARTGVDVISLGMLTQCASALDYSFSTGRS